MPSMYQHHEVPTHLNVEDKVLLGLSVRQFLYVLVGSSVAFASGTFNSGGLFVAMLVASLIVCLLYLTWVLALAELSVAMPFAGGPLAYGRRAFGPPLGFLVGTTLAFALLRPADRALEEWLAAALVFAATQKQATWVPIEPDPVDWRLAGASWQELAPSLVWGEEEVEEEEAGQT